jgi:hypothetical protein
VGWRWRADLVAAANGNESVGEELQPERKSNGGIIEDANKLRAVCTGRY